MNEVDKTNLKVTFRKYIKPHETILDVGCGIGDNMTLIKSLGYPNVIGVDISPYMVKRSIEKNHVALLPNDIADQKFDVILFSHVIEHLGYPDVVQFLEYYFSKATTSAKIVIITPVLYDAFFNDIDHIKPYFPDGLQMLFSNRDISKQYSSPYYLSLIDIYFRKAPLIPYHVRSRYRTDLVGRIIFRLICKAALFLQFITFGALAKTTGYTAIFSLNYRGDQ